MPARDFVRWALPALFFCYLLKLLRKKKADFALITSSANSNYMIKSVDFSCPISYFILSEALFEKKNEVAWHYFTNL